MAGSLRQSWIKKLLALGLTKLDLEEIFDVENKQLYRADKHDRPLCMVSQIEDFKFNWPFTQVRYGGEWFNIDDYQGRLFDMISAYMDIWRH